MAATQAEIEAAKERFHSSCNRDLRYIAMASGDEELGRGLRLADAELLADVYIDQQSQPIDETTAMPAFVGSDEIEIAGVVYVRKDQQSQPVNERLLKAARDALIEVDNDVITLSEVFCELNEAIAAAEAEIEQRRKPVTVEWLKEQPGWEVKHPSLVPSFVHKELDAQVNFWPKNGPILLFGATQINDPKHWHVLDLMQALGGATQ